VTDFRETLRTAVKGHLTSKFVPAWDRDIYIRKLSVREQLALIEDDPKPEVASLRVLLAAMADENGDRLLADDDMELLLDQTFATLAPLLTEAAKQNGLTSKELEDAMAAFEPARDEQPSSGLPSLSGEPSQNSKISVVPN
jgi:hypothetical protein